MNCPVCGSGMHTARCSCGYDLSRDYTRFPTFAPVRGAADTGPVRPKAAEEPGDLLECPDCGGRQFRFRLSTGVLQCARCGRAVSIPRPGKQPEPEAVHRASPIRAVAAGENHTVVLYCDGTVRAIGDNSAGQCETGHWTRIRAIAAGGNVTMGLRENGTVVMTGSTDMVRAVESWRGIEELCVGEEHVLARNLMGRVLALGSGSQGQCLVNGWSGITALAAGGSHSLALDSSGQVKAIGMNREGQRNTRLWRNVTAIAAGRSHSLGLTANGRVYVAGDDSAGQCRTQSWREIEAIAAGNLHSVGLRKDGTVVAAGPREQCAVDRWTDIRAIAAGGRHTVGLKKDGTLVAVGDNRCGQCDVDQLI